MRQLYDKRFIKWLNNKKKHELHMKKVYVKREILHGRYSDVKL